MRSAYPDSVDVFHLVLRPEGARIEDETILMLLYPGHVFEVRHRGARIIAAPRKGSAGDPRPYKVLIRSL